MGGRSDATPFPTLADMGAARSFRCCPSETEMGLRLPGRHSIGRAADDFRWARIYREPEWKNLFARRQKRVHVLAVRPRQEAQFDRPPPSGPRGDGWAAVFRGDFGANVYAIDALSGKPLWTTKVDDHPAAIITGAPTLVGTTLFVPEWSSAKLQHSVSLAKPGLSRAAGYPPTRPGTSGVTFLLASPDLAIAV